MTKTGVTANFTCRSPGVSVRLFLLTYPFLLREEHLPSAFPRVPLCASLTRVASRGHAYIHPRRKDRIASTGLDGSMCIRWAWPGAIVLEHMGRFT